MKRTVLMLVLTSLLITAASAGAQEYKQALRYEIKGGFNSSYLISNSYDDTGVGWGWIAGGGIFLPLFSQSFGLQIEALYSSTEADLKLSDETITELSLPAAEGNEYTAAFDNINVPLLIQLAVYNAEDFRIYIMGGVNNMFRSKTQLKYTDTDGERVTEDFVTAKNHDIGPLFAFGLRGNMFLMEFRMNFGLRSVGDEGSASDTKVADSALLVGLSF
jgi:hypothetical protein